MRKKVKLLGLRSVLTTMKEHMDITHRTWIAAVKLAVVISALAATVAVAMSTIGQIPDIAIVATVAVVAFTASWVRTGRVRDAADSLPMPASAPVYTR